MEVRKNRVKYRTAKQIEIELNLSPRTFRLISKTAYGTLYDLVIFARHDYVWHTYASPREAKLFGKVLTKMYPKLDEDGQQEVIYSLLEAGFLFQETPRSLGARRLFVDVCGDPRQLISDYESLEVMSDASLDVLSGFLTKKLLIKEKEIIDLLFGLKDGEPLEFENCARKLSLPAYRVQSLYRSAISKLSDPENMPIFRLAACCAKQELVAKRMIEIKSQIVKFEAEFTLLESYNALYDHVLDRHIEKKDLPEHTYECLKKADLLTIRELIAWSDHDLIQIEGFNSADLGAVHQILASFQGM